jgi:hypothetical protein
MMVKNASQFIAGAATLVLLILGIELAISLKLMFPDSVIEWVGASSNPRLALWVISVLISSSLIILIKVGVKLPVLKPWIEAPDHPLFSYLLGLPLSAILSILLFSGISLAFLVPLCESPTATIQVTTLDNSIIEYAGRSVTATVGTKLNIEAVANQNSVMFCEWSAVGSAVNTIGPKSSCTTQVNLANKPGKAIVTLTLSKSFCSVTSTNPIELIVIPKKEE